MLSEMLRIIGRAFQRVSSCGPAIYQNSVKIQSLLPGIQNKAQYSILSNSITPVLVNNPKIQEISNDITRTVTKFSLRKGKRKTVSAVLKRFYRLNWGIWIRTKCGRNKKLWTKHAARKRRLRQHVFCNATQSYLLDKMVNKYWRRPKYYVDDPYEPYHTREEFQFTYVKPKPYFPKEESQT